MKLNRLQSAQRCDRLFVALAAGLVSMSLVTLPAAAVRFADGTVQFAGVPRLGKVTTTDNQAYAWGAK